MNGVHDLGGMHGFGPVEHEENEPAFHARWEATMVAIQAAGRQHAIYNLDEFRHGIERMDPATYLATSYYEHWLDGITRVLLEKGVITEEELDARTAHFVQQPDAPPVSLSAAPAPAIRTAPPPAPAHPYRREGPAPRFAPGDAVVTRTFQPRGHTRLPRYARGRRGVVERVHGVMVFPDTNAHGQGEQPQPLYNVRFDGSELWGDSAESGETVYIDLWESYLRPA